MTTEKQKVSKYLTDMKELPPDNVEEKSLVDEPVIKKPVVAKETPKKEIVEDVVEGIKDEETESKKSVFSPMDIILGVINFITIVLLIYLLTRLPIKSKELQAEKITELKTQSNSLTKYSSLQSDLEKATLLNSLFLDQSGIVDFVGAVEKLKGGSSSIQKVTFASQLAVKDKLGIYGIPVVIELRGNWQTIAPDLEKIQALPYLFRPVNITVLPEKDDPTVIIFNYGGILYVNDKFGKN